MLRNKGSVTVEASAALPLFMLAVLALIYMLRTVPVQAVIYEAGTETAEYLAEYAYLRDVTEVPGAADYVMAYKKFSDYLDDKEMVEKHVKGGVKGITFIGSSFQSDDGYLKLRISYILKADTAFGSFNKLKSFVITQKCYLGYDSSNCKTELSDDEIYVYLADGSEVYHMSQNCSYLHMDAFPMSKRVAMGKGLEPCSYCGRVTGDTVYVTNHGECYHSTKSCSVIRRNVRAVKLSEVKGIMPACHKCSGG